MKKVLIIVTLYSSNTIHFKATCTLMAGLTLNMSGTKSLSIP